MNTNEWKQKFEQFRDTCQSIATTLPGQDTKTQIQKLIDELTLVNHQLEIQTPSDDNQKVVVEEYWPIQKVLHSTCEYENGLLNGVKKIYNEDGLLTELSEWKNGKQDGHMEKYDLIKVIERSEWENGLLHGKSTFYGDDGSKTVYMWKNGLKDGQSIFTCGTLHQITNWKHDKKDGFLEIWSYRNWIGEEKKCIVLHRTIFTENVESDFRQSFIFKRHENMFYLLKYCATTLDLANGFIVNWNADGGICELLDVVLNKKKTGWCINTNGERNWAWEDTIVTRDVFYKNIHNMQKCVEEYVFGLKELSNLVLSFVTLFYDPHHDTSFSLPIVPTPPPHFVTLLLA